MIDVIVERMIIIYSDDVHFRMKIDVELVQHTLSDLQRKVPDIIATTFTIVDQHKSLVFVYTNVVECFSFPSALFDEPPRGYFG